MKLLTDGRLTADQIHKLATDPLPLINNIKPTMPVGHSKRNQYNPDAKIFQIEE